MINQIKQLAEKNGYETIFTHNGYCFQKNTGVSTIEIKVQSAGMITNWNNESELLDQYRQAWLNIELLTIGEIYEYLKREQMVD